MPAPGLRQALARLIGRNAYGMTPLDNLGRYVGRRADAFGEGFGDATEWTRDVPHSGRLAVGALMGVPLGLSAAGAEGDYTPQQRLMFGLTAGLAPFALLGGYGAISLGAAIRGFQRMAEVIPHSGKRFRKARDLMVRHLRRHYGGEGARMADYIAEARNLDELARQLQLRDVGPQPERTALPPPGYIAPGMF